MLMLPFMHNAKCQDSTNQNTLGKIAFVNEAKDTMYVLRDNVVMMHEIWDLPQHIADKPVIIPVESLDRFYGRKED
jgi:hypothetical protein